MMTAEQRAQMVKGMTGFGADIQSFLESNYRPKSTAVLSGTRIPVTPQHGITQPSSQPATNSCEMVAKELIRYIHGPDASARNFKTSDFKTTLDGVLRTFLCEFGSVSYAMPSSFGGFDGRCEQLRASLNGFGGA
jgi:hypothetical protein